jgi:hypothetical protein
MIGIDEDRRRDTRLDIARSCKVFDPRGRRYVAGTTCNASCHGMLMRLHRPLACQPGDRLFLSVTSRRARGLLRADDMVEVEVVRCQPVTSGESAIAIRSPRPLEFDLPFAQAA